MSLGAQAGEGPKEQMTRWLADGKTWIGCFENKDLGHPDIGRRICIPFPMEQFDLAEVGKARAPELVRKIGCIPWQYILDRKVRTAEEAIEYLDRKERL